MEVSIISEYIATRQESQATASFWRKLSTNNDLTLKMTNMNIGKNKTSLFGVDIAKTLKLPHPQKYTGHCWRVTPINLMADNGRTKEQIKQLTG